ncbi:MAG: hypothetical protein PUF50_08365, partial [Erysipelotrichaceae bacterium]|nr:hypothetical protein [Erysipelotrichaceae bacterium]
MLDYLEYQTKKQKIIVRRKQTCFYVGIVDSKNEDSMNMTIIDEQQSDALENRWESFELSKVAKKKNKTFKTWKITWISEQEQYVICDLPKDSEQYQLLIEWLDEVAPTAKLIQPKRLDGIKMVFTYDFLANKQWKTYQETLTITRKERKVRLEQSDSEYWDYDREETIRNASLVHEILDKCQKVSLKKLPNYVMKDHTVPNLSIQLQYHDQTKKEVVRSYCEKGVTDEIAQFVNLVEQGLQGLNTGMLMWIDDGELVPEYIYYCQVSFGKDEPLCACHSLDEEIHVGDVVMVSDSKSFDMKQGLVMKVEVFEEDDFPEEYMDTPFILDKVEEHFQTITPIFEEDLKDNKSLEDAIHQLYQQESEENFEVVFQCLSKLLHSHFIIPVMQQVVEDESYLIKRIE